MHGLNTITKEEGSLIGDFSTRMGEAMIRRRAELEVRAARVEAELAIKTRSEFLANMNHELRTPLNAIMGFASLLREGDELGLSGDQRREYTGYILQSADLLLGHINTILEVAALESGSVEIVDETVDLGDILGRAIERADVQAKARKVKIERRDEGETISAWGDETRIAQAVDHLLQTAIRCCDEGGRILARACFDADGWAEIAIRDDSDGMTADEVTQSLEAFREVHRGLDRSFAGVGVGYAVAKTFIEMQNGRFFINSRKGKGTLVRFLLPQPKNIPVETPNAEQSLKATSTPLGGANGGNEDAA